MTFPVVAERDEVELKVIAENLPHALLIEAEEGLESGKAVEWLANYQVSEIIHIRPLDKKTTISVEQIRELQGEIRTQPSLRRVIIINDAHNMTESAENALLKSLEEPGQGNHFLLTTTERSQLLPTIVSRCQIISLHRTSPTQDSEILKKSVLTDGDKTQLLFLAAGRPKLISELSRQPKLFAKYKQFATDAKHLLAGGDSYVSLLIVNNYVSDRQNALRLLDTLLYMIRFQISSKGADEQIVSLLERTELAERSLKGNGNIRLALIQLV